jgi:hypothetical protein
MTIDELIKELERVKNRIGDKEVLVDVNCIPRGISHVWDDEIEGNRFCIIKKRNN